MHLGHIRVETEHNRFILSKKLVKQLGLKIGDFISTGFNPIDLKVYMCLGGTSFKLRKGAATLDGTLRFSSKKLMNKLFEFYNVDIYGSKVIFYVNQDNSLVLKK